MQEQSYQDNNRLTQDENEKQKTKSYIATEHNAHTISSSLCKLRGAALKIGQIFSTMDQQLIPPVIKQALQRARASADIMPSSQLNKALINSYGPNWRQKIFSDFNQQPIAAASIGQVHQATLKTGQKVAVKIQYPGVAKSINSDLNNFKKVIQLVGIFPKGAFFDKLIENTRVELHEECNYLREAMNQHRYRELFEGDDRFNVPKVYDQYTTRQILCSDFIQGINIDQIQRSNGYSDSVRNQIGRRILQVTLRELFEFKYMQTDPNPANYYFDFVNNKLNLIDMGACRQYSQKFTSGYRELVYSAAQNLDPQKSIDISKQIGFLTGSQNKAMKTAHLAALKAMGSPFSQQSTIGGKFDFGQNHIMRSVLKQMPIMIKNRLKAPPQEVYSLHRKLSGCFLICNRLQANFNARQIFMKIYEKTKK